MPLIKEDTVLITQIVSLEGKSKANIFGLGNDGNVYLWSWYGSNWIVYNNDTP